MSTGVVARALELDPKVVRAMVDIGSLPSPQWMNLGNRRERVYSLEWLLLASEQLNARRLPGLESELGQDQFIQFALRFEKTDWASVRSRTSSIGSTTFGSSVHEHSFRNRAKWHRR